MLGSCHEESWVNRGALVKSYEALSSLSFPLSQRFIEDLTGKNLFYQA
jgi:hypothetical protein